VKNIRLITYLVLLPLLYSANVSAVVNDDAATIYLRTSCQEGVSSLDNCFTDMSSAINWINNTRNPKPGALAPLSMEIGPGTFDSYICNNMDYINLRGSGQNVTTLRDSTGLGSVLGFSCDNLSFHDLTLMSRGYWVSQGDTVWTNIIVHGGFQGAWYDTGGIHYWYNSKFIVDGGIGYTSNGGSESWFYGSEFNVTGPGTSNASPGPIIALEMINGATAIVIGSVVRVQLKAGATLPAGGEGMTAIKVSGNGRVHLHGSVVGVVGNELGNDVSALVAESGGTIHANGTGYNMSNGPGGNIYRIINNGGEVRAPYSWESQPEVPNVTSVTGSDTAVVTNTTDGQPHIVVYSSNCPSKWYDTTVSACR